jgi:NAD(P)-dependent dehydrogenase (short-subunit alcohol dehydrogenase family)
MTSPAPERSVAIVTGTGRGIGEACAQVFLRSGYAVIGADKVSASLELAPSPHYHHYICDLSEPEQAVGLVTQAATNFGRVDAVINNVGTHPPVRKIDAISTEAFLDLIRVNVLSGFTISKAALPMLRKSHGVIVNIGSLVGLAGQDGSVDYCATKGAISAMTKALAIDEAPNGVRVNTVCPGAIHTPLAESVHSPEQLETLAAWSWAERMGSAAEVAEVVLFLASPAASYVTGQEVVVAGGADLGYGLKGTRYYAAMTG